MAINLNMGQIVFYIVVFFKIGERCCTEGFCVDFLKRFSLLLFEFMGAV